MSTEANRTIALRVTEAINTRDWDALSELMSPEMVEVFRSSPFLDAFPDIQIIDEDTLVDGDKVIKRWVDVATHTGTFAGIEPTGKRIRVEGISIDRIENGKVVESWMAWDELGLMRQIGAVPGAE